MFSKSHLIAIIILAAGLISASCGKWLNEDPPAPSVIELDKDRTRCLKNWSETIDKYLLGKSTSGEVDEFWMCLDSVVSHFQKHARGGTPGLYSISELRKFLEDFFLSPRKIPDGLVEQFKDLKRAIFSGDRDNFNQEDLRRLHLIIAEFKLASRQILPYVSYLTFSARDDSKLDGAISTVVDISERWQKELSPIHSSYRLEDLLKFWSELKRVLEVKSFVVDDKKWDQILRAAKSIKALLVGAPGEEILKDDWPILYQRMSDAVTIAWLYKYRFKDHAWHSQVSVGALKTVSKLLFRSIRSSTFRHPNMRIPLSQFDEIARVVADNGWLGTGAIHSNSLSTALQSIVIRVGRDGASSFGNSDGLSASGLNFIERVVAHWSITQSAINYVFEKDRRMTRNQFAKRWKEYMSRAPLAEDEYFLAERDVALNFFYGVLKDIEMRTSQPGKMLFIFSKNVKEKSSVEYEAVTHLNWMYRLMNVIYYGYSDSQDFINIDQFDMLYSEFRNLGIDLKLLDPKVTNSARRTFTEANTFTFNANGDGLMSIAEAIEEMQILMSGGKASSYIMTAASESCIFNFKSCLGSKVDQFGRVPLEIKFFKGFLVQNFAQYFSHLPELVKDFNSWDGATKLTFVDTIVNAVLDADNKNYITLGELRTLSGLIHFAESIMLRYDEDRSSTIEAGEINAAFRVFRSFLSDAILKSTGKTIDPEYLRVGFAYFLMYGERLPAVWYYTTKIKLESNQVHLTRFQIVKAMANFKSFTSSN